MKIQELETQLAEIIRQVRERQNIYLDILERPVLAEKVLAETRVCVQELGWVLDLLTNATRIDTPSIKLGVDERPAKCVDCDTYFACTNPDGNCEKEI